MKRITLEERGAQIDRKLAAGVRVPPLKDLLNTGARRTESKRRLLATLDRIRHGNPPRQD